MKETTSPQNQNPGQGSGKKAMRVGSKITLLSFSMVALTILILIAIVFIQKSRLSPKLGSYLDQQAYSEADKLVQTILDTCAGSEAQSRASLDHCLGVLGEMVQRQGAVTLNPSEKVAWDVEDAVTHQSKRVELPKLMLGTNWLGQNFTTNTPSFVVDETHKFADCSATIFQRINDAGDFARVATSNLKTNGTRGIGTVLSAVNANGTPNPIIETVLKGGTYRGRSLVVGSWHYSAYEPIWDPSHTTVIGIMGVGTDLGDAVAAVRSSVLKVRLGKTGYMFVLGSKGALRGQYIVSQNGKRDGESVWETKDENGNLMVQEIVKKGTEAGVGKTALVEYLWKDAGTTMARQKFAAVGYYEPWDWVVGASAYYDEYREAQSAAMNTLTQMLWWTAGVATLLAIVAFVVSSRLSRSITKPLNVLANTADRVAKGDNTVRAEVLSDDEIGQLGDSFNAMLEARIKAKEDTDDYKRLQDGIQQLLKVTSDASDGDLTVRAKVTEGALGNVCDAMNLMLENVGDMFKEVQGVASRVASSATEIQASSEQLAQGSVRQSGEIINTTTAVQEMAANIESVSNNATAANEAATRARQAAEAGAKAVEQVIEGMTRIRQNVQAGAKKIKRLGERSMEISTIVNTISQISGQTDMLALNAAIEAARAGEHGRGFTVVAEEVRKLAERTATATKEIEKLIAGIQAETNESVSAMEQQTAEVETESKVVASTGGELARIRESSTQSADLINEINLAAKQQVRGASGVVKAMETVSTIAQQAQAGAGQTKRATESLAGLSSELMTSLSKFKINTNGNGHS